MSYADVVNQMQAIQTQLAQLGMVRSTTTSTTSAASAASFATALDSASATEAAPAVSTSSTASTDGTLVSPNGVTGDDVVQAALDYKGVPYVLGGESKSGIDCSGLVQAALAKVGVSAPRLVHQQETVGQKVDSLEDAKPGDLIVLNGSDHIAVYMGNDTVIHAPYPGRNVSVQKVWFDDSDITSIRRVVPATDDVTATAATAATTAATGILGGAPTSTSTSSAAASSGLSAGTIAKATSMLTSYGGDVGLYDSSGSSSGGTSLSSLLASFGLTGTSTATSTSSSSTSAQQILAARTALLGASA